jgi:hypothetical protein
MATRVITLIATGVGIDAGPFNVIDNLSNLIATNITRIQLLAGINIQVTDE